MSDLTLFDTAPDPTLRKPTGKQAIAALDALHDLGGSAVTEDIWQKVCDRYANPPRLNAVAARLGELAGDEVRCVRRGDMRKASQGAPQQVWGITKQGEALVRERHNQGGN